MPDLKSLLRALACSAFLAAAIPAAAQARAETFPSRAVTIVVPFSAGGGADTVARTIARALSAKWGQPVVVENPTGADGLIGTRQVLQKPADGHTILMQVSPMLMWPVTMPQAGVNIHTDFQLISKVQSSPQTISTSSRFAGNTLAELLDSCRKAAAPPCSVGTATTFGALIGRALTGSAGIPDASIVTYKGTAPAMNDILGGHLTFGVVTAANAASHAAAGTLKVLAISSAKRFAAMPNVPTFTELGYPLPADVWYGLMVARGTPAARVEAIVSAVRGVADDPEVVKAIKAAGGEPVFNTPREFDAELRSEQKALITLLKKYPQR
jgi:tripartite-type tricarboxylate transporter receptor subunit TctC